VSKRAREAALKRECERLFPPGFWDLPEKSEEQKRREKIESLRRNAERLLHLASGGMRPRKYKKEAERLLEQARIMEASNDLAQ